MNLSRVRMESQGKEMGIEGREDRERNFLLCSHHKMKPD